MGQGNFRPELFTEPSEYEETPLRDRKQKIPNLRNHEEKAEFLRDVIALANTARLWGKPTYLIFGLDDRGNQVSIYQHLQPYWSESLPTDEKGLTNVMEEVRHQMRQAINEYISPTLSQWELKWNWDERNNLLLAYFLIEPQSPREAFHIARDLTSGRRTLLHVGGCWIRSGESKMKIEVQDFTTNSPGYRQIPLVTPSGWLRYFRALRESEEVSRAAAKNPYLDLYIDAVGRREQLKEVVQRFLTNGGGILVIEGCPGSGKSMFLFRLVAEYADAGMAAMEEIRRREEFKPPPWWIPVYFRLRGSQIRSAQILAKEIVREANTKGQFWKDEPESPEMLLENPDLHWLICLDGIDELWEERLIERCLDAIRSFSRRYPGVAILLTTRPSISIPNDMQTVRIAPLAAGQVTAYLRGAVTEGNERIIQQLEKGFSGSNSEWHSLKDICSIPLYLESLVSVVAPDVPLAEPLPASSPSDYTKPDEEESPLLISRPESIRWEEEQPEEIPIQPPSQSGEEQPEEIPIQPPSQSGEEQQAEETGPSLTIGWALDRMIRRVWEREASRRSIERANLSRWWGATGRFGLEIDGRSDAMEYDRAKRCYSSKKGLHWVLNLAILQTSNGSVKFFHSLFQYYFSATYLMYLLKENARQLDRWKLRCTPDFWQSVVTILNQIQYSGGAL